MEKIDLKAFRKANKISQTKLGKYFGVGQSFISQIEQGTRPVPPEYISKILADSKWDTSMLGIASPHLAQGAVAPIVKVVGDVKRPETSQDAVYRLLVEDYKRQIKDKDALVQELCKKIGMLEAQIEVLTKGGVPYVAITTPEDAK
jgi:transcriptional regulator with XRE-family HTH domain